MIELEGGGILSSGKVLCWACGAEGHLKHQCKATKNIHGGPLGAGSPPKAQKDKNGTLAATDAVPEELGAFGDLCVCEEMHESNVFDGDWGPQGDPWEQTLRGWARDEALLKQRSTAEDECQVCIALLKSRSPVVTANIAWRKGSTAAWSSLRSRT